SAVEGILRRSVQSHQHAFRGGSRAGGLWVCQALLLSLSAVSLSLVCEEDGTEVDSDEFLMTLPDNTMLMALEPGQTWRQQPGSVVAKSQAHSKTHNGRDIARVTFDFYKISPKDVFASLSVKATFQGLYSVSADFQCLRPKNVLREALRVCSTLLQAAGHLLITSASMIHLHRGHRTLVASEVRVHRQLELSQHRPLVFPKHRN
uniref:CIDE-N domain-containing protein n=1 Tax=Mola mola TaxID=94237 RepID=A0A3Q4BDB9_MOLML